MSEIKKIICYHTHIELNDYYPGECLKLEHALSLWDKVYFKYIPIGYIFDGNKQSLLMPSGVSATWVASLTGRPIEMNYDADPYENIHLRITKPPRDELQVDSLKFLAGKGEYSAYAKYPQLVLNLDTGMGKTYITIAQIAYKGLKSIIIVHSEKIKEQWIETLIDDTNIDPKKICEIKGSPKCIDILKKPKKYNNYSIFVIKHATLRSFGDTYGWWTVHDLFIALNVGIKVYDEVHREFANIVRTDCFTNTKYTYYLTATFGRSDDNEMRIYKRCFQNIPKFEQKKRSDYEGKPHITYMCIFYRSNPSFQQMAMLKTKYGFNRNAYANYQVEDDEKFFSILGILVRKSVVEQGFKTLLLMSTISGIDRMVEYMKNEHPGISVGAYHSKVPPEEKERAIECKLIVTTEKSLGEGADITGLKTVINTESFKSLIITEQIVGRLRKPADGSGCIYIETVDTAFQTLRAQQRTREKFLSKLVGGIKYVKM